MSDKKYTLGESLFIFLAVPVIGIPAVAIMCIVMFPITMLIAWVRYLLYGWFAVPFFHAPTIPYWAMVGIGVLVSCFVPNFPPNGYKPETKEIVGSLASHLIGQLLLLGVGLLIHTYLLR